VRRDVLQCGLREDAHPLPPVIISTIIHHPSSICQL
jgi:hypothetical protein